jgi:hypothetical protein|tara:strand:+ start:45 stop:329 length:285 start_codon:yes stop_codon:yes gene_type:complete
MAFEHPELIEDTDNGELIESIDLATEFKDKLKWTKIGFLWSMSLSTMQRRVAYRRIFLFEKFSLIADDLGLSPSTVRSHWELSIKKALELMSED